MNFILLEIYSAKTYFCRQNLFLPAKTIFAGKSYSKSYFCRQKLFLPAKPIFATLVFTVEKMFFPPSGKNLPTLPSGKTVQYCENTAYVEKKTAETRSTRCWLNQL